MTNLPPDPEPPQVPGLERGGGVAPGDTPPDAGQTSVGEEPGPVPTGSRFTTGSVLTIALVVIFALAFLAIAIGVLIQM